MKKKTIIKDIIMLCLIGILVGLDQLTKYLVVTKLSGGSEVVLINKVLKFVYHRNTGAVWGIFSDKTMYLSIVTIIIMLAVLWFYFKLPWDNKKLSPLKIISAFVMAGAIGNLIDRLSLKYVVDFIYFELIDFPVFNVADCYITVSMILVLILFIFYYRDKDFDFLDKKKKQEVTDGQSD